MDRWTRTHNALQAAALELFTAQGYESTGTAQIAERAGVSEMTLFRHFGSKEALLLADPFDPAIARAVQSRPESEPAMRALAEGIRQAWAEVDAEAIDALRQRLSIVAGAPNLRGAFERNSEMTMEVLADALVSRGVAGVAARVASAAMIAGLSVALLAWAQSPEADLSDVLGEALETLAGN